MKSFVNIREYDEDGEYLSVSIPMSKVEVLNIEEDIEGKDVVTFLYKQKEYKSYVILNH